MTVKMPLVIKYHRTLAKMYLLLWKPGIGVDCYYRSWLFKKMEYHDEIVIAYLKRKMGIDSIDPIWVDHG